ncbi:MAG: acetylglutamate kinase [Acidobacteria bacterium]|nr:acetylglutamate kinase [Acidobacteriota bacterium]
MRVTIKLGGTILEEEESRREIVRQLAEAIHSRNEIIVVHGGGRSITRRLEQMGIPSRFARGLRITDRETLAVALMVLAGEVNKNLVRTLGSAGVRAVGICGADADCVRCERMPPPAEDMEDLGFVGVPDRVDRDFFEALLSSGLTPVVASLALGPDRQLYNVNADQMASTIAWGTGSGSLVYLTDVPGVLDGAGEVIDHLGSPEIADMLRNGLLTGGMLPKTSACLDAIRHGVGTVRILPGRTPGLLSRFLRGQPAGGTQIHGEG